MNPVEVCKIRRRYSVPGGPLEGLGTAKGHNRDEPCSLSKNDTPSPRLEIDQAGG